jgi:hypothetical protein
VISDVDLALSGEELSFREQLRILSLLEEIFGEDGFDAVFLAGEELAPREAVLNSILREGVDAEEFVRGSNRRLKSSWPEATPPPKQMQSLTR